MATTLGDIITLALQRADLENSNFIPTNESIFLANSSLAELYGILATSYEDYFTESTEFSIPDGADGYDLATNFFKIRGLDFFTGGQYVNVHRFNFEDRNTINRPINLLLIGLNDMRYRITGKKLYIIPNDMAGGQYRLWFIPKFSPLVSLTDPILSNLEMEDWFEYAIVDVAIKMLQKEESDTQLLMLQKQQLAARIVAESMNRDSAQPERVTDIRTSPYAGIWRY